MASPRLSFSRDIPESDLFADDDSRREPESPASDFDFSTSFEVSMQETSFSSADELFYGGKILPLPIKNANLPPSPRPTPASNSLRAVMDKKEEEENDASVCKRTPERKSFWGFSRSGSVGSGDRKPKASTLCPFRRSKSAGFSSSTSPTSTPNTNTRTSSKFSSSKSSKTYYYSGVKRWSHGSGVRINPVLNVPAAYLPRGGSTGSCSSNSSNTNGSNSSIFGYLLCKCSSKGMEAREVTCYP